MARETELNSSANKDKWAFVFKKQEFGVSGWKVAKRKQQRKERFLLDQLSRITEEKTGWVIRFPGWIRYQGLGIFLKLP